MSTRCPQWLKLSSRPLPLLAGVRGVSGGYLLRVGGQHISRNDGDHGRIVQATIPTQEDGAVYGVAWDDGKVQHRVSQVEVECVDEGLELLGQIVVVRRGKLQGQTAQIVDAHIPIDAFISGAIVPESLRMTLHFPQMDSVRFGDYTLNDIEYTTALRLASEQLRVVSF